MAPDPAEFTHLAFLCDLDPSSLQPLLARARVRDVKRRTVIFLQEEPSDTAYIVVKGQVRISVLSSGGAEMVLDLLGPGDSFGIAGLAGDIPRVSNAIAGAPTRLLEIPTGALRALMDRHPVVQQNLLGQILRRLTLSIQEHVAAGTQRVYGRVAAKLVGLSEEFPDGERRLPLSISHQDLASMVGSTRATVTRVLQEMRRQGLLEIDAERRQIVLPEARCLLEACGLGRYLEASATVFP